MRFRDLSTQTEHDYADIRDRFPYAPAVVYAALDDLDRALAVHGYTDDLETFLNIRLINKETTP